MTGDWEPVVAATTFESKSTQVTNSSYVEELVQKCLTETASVHKEKYDAEKAEKTAAMFLEARIHLALFIEEIELRARQSKMEIDRVEAERYFHYKTSISSDKKITDTALNQYVAKDDEVIAAKQEAASAESELKKWIFLIDTLKDGLFYFRGLGKKTDF